MAIKRFYSKRASKPGWKWDAAKGQFWSWGYDERIDGRRIREAGFSSDDQVKVVVGKLKEKELLAKHGLITRAGEPLVTVPQLVEARAQAFDFNNAQHRQRYGVLKAFRDRFSPLTQVRQLTTEHLEAYVQERQATAPDLKPATLERELNVIRSMLHSAGEYFPVLAQWQPPRLPVLPKHTPAEGRRGRGRPAKLPREKWPEVRERYAGVLKQAQIARELIDAGIAEKEVREQFSETFSEDAIKRLLAGEQPSDVAIECVAGFYEVSEETVRACLYRKGCNKSGV